VSDAVGGEGTEAFDRLRRRVLWAMPTGLFVVGSRAGATRNLMTCNWAMQIAMSPKLVAVAVESGSVTRRLIDEGGSFSVSLLARSDRGLVRRFVKPVRDVELDDHGVATSLQGEPVVEVSGGLPVLAASVAWLACSVRSVTTWDDLMPEGSEPAEASHVLVVGEVVDAGESDRLAALGDDAVLSMADTRMNYGG
jgi:flavin reductase (DIM6/NTAB) family NADH-FMN oxidoreductase RutF